MREMTFEDIEKYKGKYDRNTALKLLKKLRKITRNKPALLQKPVGVIVECLGHLLSALDNPNTPLWLKAQIMCAIAYIVSPIDIVPDAIPIVGFSDDVGAVMLIFDNVKLYSTFSMKELDDEIDGISSAEPVVDENIPLEIMSQIESVERQAEEDPVTSAAYDSTTHSFEELSANMNRGNELFQKFLDENYDLDNQFFENTQKSDELSSDMWNAINKI